MCNSKGEVYMEKMVAIKELAVGDFLANSVLSITGKILLGKDIELTSRHISLLTTWDIKNVFIHVEEQLVDESLVSSISPENSEEYLNFFQEYNSIITNTAQSFEVIKKRDIIPVNHLKDTASNIYTSIVNNNFEVMKYLLMSDQQLGGFVPWHSVMVAYFAGIIARQMKWSEADIAGVAFAGLLHDIGNLTKERNAQANIMETARLLKGTKGLSSEVVLGVIQHRERANSTGFPTGVQGAKIHPYAKIIAVADSFHSLAYANEYANPFPALDMLEREMYEKFDPDMCQKLISRVRDSLQFNKVLLSSGQEAEIIFFHKNSYSAPIVKTMDEQIIDLSKNNSLKINRILIPA